jgi:hypothetical protein
MRLPCSYLLLTFPSSFTSTSDSRRICPHLLIRQKPNELKSQMAAAADINGRFGYHARKLDAATDATLYEKFREALRLRTQTDTHTHMHTNTHTHMQMHTHTQTNALAEAGAVGGWRFLRRPGPRMVHLWLRECVARVPLVD